MAVAGSRWLGGLAAVLAVAGLAGCTSTPAEDRPPVIAPGRPGEPASTLPPGQATPPRPTPPNTADVTYLRNMVVHHQQALEMAALAPQRAASDEVKRLADRISVSQRTEIDAMNDWLRDHGQPEVPPGGHAGHGSHPDPATMPGMATPAQLDELRAASGPGFDDLFLRLMIAHHEGALTMAGEVQLKGSDVLIQEIADDVIATQTAEINRMRALRGS